MLKKLKYINHLPTKQSKKYFINSWQKNIHMNQIKYISEGKYFRGWEYISSIYYKQITCNIKHFIQEVNFPFKELIVE